jgi:hypothetical protein
MIPVMNASDESTDRVFTISCDECAMQRTTACNDCVVTYLLDGERPRAPDHGDELVLDPDQVRVVQLFGAAGMVPRLRYHVAS